MEVYTIEFQKYIYCSHTLVFRQEPCISMTLPALFYDENQGSIPLSPIVATIELSKIYIGFPDGNSTTCAELMRNLVVHGTYREWLLMLWVLQCWLQ